MGLLGEESTLRLLGEEASKGRVAIYARVSSAIRKKIWRGRSKDLSNTPRARGLETAPQIPDGCRSFRSPRRPSHEKRREGMKVNARPERQKHELPALKGEVFGYKK